MQLIAKKWTRNGKVTIEANNSRERCQISVYDISADNAADADMPPAFSTEMDGQFTKVWKMTIPKQTVWRVSYTGKGGGMLDIRRTRTTKRWWWISMSKEELDARSMKALMTIASTWYDQMKAGDIRLSRFPPVPVQHRIPTMQARSGSMATKRACGQRQRQRARRIS